MKIKNILSLFDGISVGQIALQKADIQYEKYFASEIDKYAVSVTRYNFPETIFLGDIRTIDEHKLPQIDLLIGGSPCTDLSVSGKRQGMVAKSKIQITSLDQYLKFKKEGISFIGQSYLFWEYVRLLKAIKPKYFLLENVKMKKEWRDIISKTVGVEPIEINSALVSAQQRKRLYWTNIPVKGFPRDKHIYLKDILEQKSMTYFKKFQVIDEYKFIRTKTHLGKNYFDRTVRVAIIKKGGQGERIYSIRGKSVTLSANGGGRGAKTGLYLIDDNVPADITIILKSNYKPYVRKLTPIECERLQTIPDNYTQFGNFDTQIKEISTNYRYKLIGNAWTADVIAWIFSFIK